MSKEEALILVVYVFITVSVFGLLTIDLFF